MEKGTKVNAIHIHGGNPEKITEAVETAIENLKNSQKERTSLRDRLVERKVSYLTAISAINEALELINRNPVISDFDEVLSKTWVRE